MPYVQRDESGRVVGLFDQPTEFANEQLAARDPEVLAFLYSDRANAEAEARLIASDLGLLRVLEDLIVLLIEKGVIAWTELPPPAQTKLIERRSLRSYVSSVTGMGSGAGNLLDELAGGPDETDDLLR